MGFNIKSQAMTVIQWVAQQIHDTICQHAKQHLLKGIVTDGGCNEEVIAVK
jgi:hypothetical protein